MPRRKKYPGVAYKTNELFDPAPADDIRPQQASAFDRARVRQYMDILALSLYPLDSPGRCRQHKIWRVLDILIIFKRKR